MRLRRALRRSTIKPKAVTITLNEMVTQSIPRLRDAAFSTASPALPLTANHDTTTTIELLKAWAIIGNHTDPLHHIKYPKYAPNNNRGKNPKN